MRLALFYSIAAITLLSCGPSPKKMAEKSCDLFSKYYQAKEQGDSSTMKMYQFRFDSLNKALMNKYETSNPEWLMQFTNQRNQCIIDLSIK